MEMKQHGNVQTNLTLACVAVVIGRGRGEGEKVREKRRTLSYFSRSYSPPSASPFPITTTSLHLSLPSHSFWVGFLFPCFLSLFSTRISSNSRENIIFLPFEVASHLISINSTTARAISHSCITRDYKTTVILTPQRRAIFLLSKSEYNFS